MNRLWIPARIGSGQGRGADSHDATIRRNTSLSFGWPTSKRESGFPGRALRPPRREESPAGGRDPEGGGLQVSQKILRSSV